MNILPKPQYVEKNIGNYENKHLVPVDSISDILSPEKILQLHPHLSSEQFRKEGYILKTTQEGTLIYSESEVGLFRGINTSSKLSIDEILIVDYPTFEIRAFFEKFYGIPWTGDQRKDLIDVCSQHGFNHFIFGPCDYNLKANWRQPLDDQYKEKLEDLISYSHEHHVKFVYEILPISVDLNSDYEILRERFQEAIGLDVDGLIFALDDTNDYQGRSAKKGGQVEIVNKLSQEFNDVLLCFVPVEYHGTKDSKYLKALREELDPAVFVGWTGKKIRSPTVTIEDAKRYGELIGRKPFLGHNFPVVDEVDKKRRITTGPLMGLEQGLSEHLSGIGFNFMELPYASLVPGMTCIDYAWNPLGYDATESITNSCNIFGPELIALAQLNPESYVNLNGVHPLAGLFKKKQLTPDEKDQLNALFDTMTNLDTLIAKTDPRIYGELRPWLNQANLVGMLGKMALDSESKYNWKVKAFGVLKMIGGYRFGGRVYEDWIMRKLKVPAPLRYIADFFERGNRGRHKNQK